MSDVPHHLFPMVTGTYDCRGVCGRKGLQKHSWNERYCQRWECRKKQKKDANDRKKRLEARRKVA